MQFGLLSDLHLEFDKNLDAIIYKLEEFNKTSPVDYLILAGDITTIKHKEKLLKLILPIHNAYQKIFFILGNHEYYSEKSESTGYYGGTDLFTSDAYEIVKIIEIYVQK